MRIPARHRHCWKISLQSPKLRFRGKPKLSLKFPLLNYPEGVEDVWTAKQFIAAGMPSAELPSPGSVSTSISASALNGLRAKREQLLPFSPWERKVFEIISDIVTTGIPNDGPRVPPATGKHRLTPEELKFALDKMGQFISKGYVYGPVDKSQWPSELGEPHSIGVFLRDQKNTESVRIITNCSAPHKASINDYNSSLPKKAFPYRMSEAQNVIDQVLSYGTAKILEITKIDLSDAFKIIPVKYEALYKQVIEICSCLFVDSRLLFGDNRSAHWFVLLHLALQTLFIFPYLQLPVRHMKLAIDDSTFVAPADTNLCHQYHKLYSSMASDLGLHIKAHDPALDKAYEPSLVGGNVLGLILHLPSRSWSVSQMKMNHISEVFSQVVNVQAVFLPVLATLKDTQEVAGLVTDFSKSSQLIRTLAMLVNAERNEFTVRFSSENIKDKQDQSKFCLFSFHARKNLTLIRAILLNTDICPLPMEMSGARFLQGGAADFSFYCDASGKPKEIADGAYAPTCLGSYRPRTVSHHTATLKSFILPYDWLTSYDKHGQVYHHTSLLELLPVLCELLDQPQLYQGRVLHFLTDNQATAAIFRRQNPASESTAYILEAINLTEMALGCRIKMSWQRRRSSYGMVLADDATHADHSSADSSIKCTRQSLPVPLFNVLHQPGHYLSHQLHHLRKQIKLYLRDKCPSAQFPV